MARIIPNPDAPEKQSFIELGAYDRINCVIALYDKRDSIGTLSCTVHELDTKKSIPLSNNIREVSTNVYAVHYPTGEIDINPEKPSTCVLTKDMTFGEFFGDHLSC